MYTNNINPTNMTNSINPINIPDVINISDKNPNAKFKYADTLTILIRTRVRGYPTILYTPSMSVPNMKSNNVYFNPVIKLNSSTTSTIPRGYPPSERMSQFFYKNTFNSLLNRTLSTTFMQPKRSLETAVNEKIIENNIRIILNELFRPNNKFYIKGKPYTIYDYNWINGDWQIDTKSFERNLMSFSYGTGLASSLYQQRLLASHDAFAQKELGSFAKAYPELVKGYAASKGISRFLTNGDLIKDIASGKKLSDKEIKVEDEKQVLKYVTWIKTLPPGIQTLIGRNIDNSIINVSDNISISVDPITQTLLYPLDRNYSEDIKLNPKKLDPLYQTLYEAGIEFREAENIYETSLGIYNPNTSITNNIPVAVPVVANANAANTSPSTTAIPSALPSAFDNVNLFDTTTHALKKIIKTSMENNFDATHIWNNPDDKKNITNLMSNLINYKTAFMEAYKNTLDNLLEKVKAQRNYFEALINFYKELVIAKKKQFKKNGAETNDINKLIIQIMEFDIECYSQFVTKNNEYDNFVIQLNTDIRNIINEMNKPKYNTQIFNYKEEFEKYYRFPQLLDMNKNQLNIYIKKLLDLYYRDEERVWKLEYSKTNKFFISTRDNIFNLISVARTLYSHYIDTYSENQRRNFTTRIVQAQKPLQKQSVLFYESSNTYDFKKQTNDYMKLQEALKTCYNLITMYGRLSAITYAREIESYTSTRNIYTTTLSIYDEYKKYYNSISKNDSIIPYIPASIYRNIQLSPVNVKTEIIFMDTKYNTTSRDLNKLEITMDNLVTKYNDIIDSLIPYISDFGIKQKCITIVNKSENANDIPLLTTGEKIIKDFNVELDKDFDWFTTEDFQNELLFLYDKGIYEEVIPEVDKNSIANIVSNIEIYEEKGARGDSLFYAVALAFNGELISTGNVSTNPFADEGKYTISSLRRAISDRISDAELAAWTTALDNGNININDPENAQTLKELNFLYDDTGTYINEPNIIKGIIRQTAKDGGRYRGDETAIKILERVFKIKFIVIDVGQNPVLTADLMLDIGTHVIFKVNTEDAVSDYKSGTIVRRQIRNTPIPGQDNTKYIIIDDTTFIEYDILHSQIVETEEFSYDVICNEINRGEKTNEYQTYLFLLKTYTIDGNDHYEILYDKTTSKFLFSFVNIPSVLTYLIFKSCWKYSDANDREISWFNGNDIFKTYLDDSLRAYNELKNNKRIELNAAEIPVPIAANTGPIRRRRRGKQNEASGMQTKRQGLMRGGALNSQQFVDINRPNAPTKNDTNLSYYVVIDLELYPGEDIPLSQRAVLGCQIRYEKIRQAYADMFGFVYQPIELKEENYRAPITKQNNYGQNNARQNTRKYMNRNYRDNDAARRSRRRR